MIALRVVIVGGGYSGVSAAVQLVRKTQQPLDITIIESRSEAGPGLAYTTCDPSFRLNAHAGMHSIDIDDPAGLIRWCMAQGLPESDPECVAPNGQFFVRRMDFGRYLTAMVTEHAVYSKTGSTIRHIQARASDLTREDHTWQLVCDDGATVLADRVVLATGNPPQRLPSVLRSIEGHGNLVGDPLKEAALVGVQQQAKVLVIGTGLTALDVIASLLRQGHQGSITAVSRRGLRPRPQPPSVFAVPIVGAPVVLPLDLLFGPLPAYVELQSLTAHGLLRGLRAHIVALAQQGMSWQMPFDLLAATVWRVWPKLPLEEKARFLKRLKPWWDVHRFRTPPMTDALVRSREDAGQVKFLRAAVCGSSEAGTSLMVHLQETGHEAKDHCFDAVINCTGFEAGNDLTENPLLASLYDRDMIKPHPCGIGLSVDFAGRPLNSTGQPLEAVHVIGPPSAGEWGDPMGVLFISAQIHRTIPKIVGP